MQLFGSYKVVAIHTDGDLVLSRTGYVTMNAPHNVSETPYAHQRITCGKCYDVFHALPSRDIDRREKADTGGADITSFFGSVEPLLSQLHNSYGKLQFVPWCPSLFQSFLLYGQSARDSIGNSTKNPARRY